MALFDNNPLYENISSLANPITSGIGGLFKGMTPFGSSIPSGILDPAQEEKLRNQALFQGLLGTAATYLATPKNLNAGSPLPYIGKAFLGGMGASQDVIDRALTSEYRKQLTANRGDNIRTIKQDRFEITQEKQPDGTYKEIARSPIDAPKEEKQETTETIKNYNEAKKGGYSGSFVDFLNLNKKEGFNINLGSPVAGVDAQGKPVFFQPSKTGGPPTIIQGVKPPEATANKLTEGERTAGFLSTRLSNSLKQLQTATGQDPSAASPNIGAEATKFFTRSDYFKNLVNPESRQQVEAAQYDILDSALTLGTGAAYTREQLESYRKSFFPQLGDKDKTIQDKAKRLQGVLDAAYQKAGRAAPNENQPENKSKTVVRTGKDKSGKKVVEYSDGSIGYGD
jgi:hypothetical protein